MHMDQNERIRNWLRKQLQEYGLTPNTLSERLDWLSAPTIERLLNGRLLWSAIPREDKLEVTPKLEAILGPLPGQEESQIPENANFRPVQLEQPLEQEDVSELIRDIEKDIQGLRTGEALQRSDAIFEVCNRCQKAMMDSKGECHECGRISDGAQ
jgi:hypothetical protein